MSSRTKANPGNRRAARRPEAEPGERIGLKRAYEPPGPDDGKRILVDRLWPRGVSKGEAKLDLWLKEIAPSTALRKWFAHDPERWPEFRRRYLEELKSHPELTAELLDLAGKGPVTLVYSAHDELHNDAVVLRDFLGKELRRR